MPSSYLDSSGILWVNDSNPNDGLREAWNPDSYTNVNGVVVGTGIDVVADGDWIDGNNQLGSIGMTLQGNATLSGALLVTNFAAGIFGAGAGNHIIGSYQGAIHVQSVHNMGIAVSGNTTVANADIDYVGWRPGNAHGLVGWNGDNRFWYCDISNLSGGNETSAITMGGGGDIYDVTATNLSGHTGWSFGAWLNAGNYTINYLDATGFDNGIANAGYVDIAHSTVNGRVADIVNKDTFHFLDSGSNSFSTAPHGSGTITGTSGVDHLVGSSGNDTFAGNGETDVLYGMGGSDTFVFFGDTKRLVLPDYNPDDSLDLGAFDPLSSVSFNAGTHEFFVGGVARAYLPQIESVNDIAWFF